MGRCRRPQGFSGGGDAVVRADTSGRAYTGGMDEQQPKRGGASRFLWILVLLAVVVLWALVTWVFPWVDSLLGPQEGTVGP